MSADVYKPCLGASVVGHKADAGEHLMLVRETSLCEKSALNRTSAGVELSWSAVGKCLLGGLDGLRKELLHIGLVLAVRGDFKRVCLAPISDGVYARMRVSAAEIDSDAL